MWMNDPNCVPRSKRKYRNPSVRKTLIRRGQASVRDGTVDYSYTKKNIERCNEKRVSKAIKFSLTIQPEIEAMLDKSYSIPQMMKTLDSKGIAAERGGKWYAEGFRRMLKRILLNKKAQELKEVIQGFQADNMSLEAMADELNAQEILDSRGMPWDETRVNVLIERMDILIEIERDKE